MRTFSNARCGAVRVTWPLLLVLLAIVVRLLFFVGYQGRDDRNYIAYAEFVNSGGHLSQLDVQTPWIGRIGFWIPLAGSMKALGNTQAGYAAYSFTCSLAGVLLILALGRMTVGAGPAVLAGLLLTVMPLDVLYATKAYPDLPVGLYMTAAFWLVLRSRQSRSVLLPCTAGLLLGLAYLHKESAVFAFIPFAITLRAWPRAYWRQVVLCGSAFAIVVFAELGFWSIVKQDPLYRLHTTDAALEQVVERQVDRRPARLLPGPRPDDVYRSENSLLDAILMLTTNEEFALFYWLALPIVAFSSWRRDRGTRDLRLWVLILLPMLLFLPVLEARYTLARDPRYYTCLTIPLLLVFSSYLFRVRPVVRWLTVGLVVSTSLAAIFIGRESSRMEPHQTLARRYAASEEILWTTPQIAADLLIMGGMDTGARLAVHLLEQGRTAASYQAVQMIRPTIPVADVASEISSGILVLRERNADRLPSGWIISERLRPQPSRPIALLQAGLRATGFGAFASKLAPGGGESVILCRRTT